jgi:orotidine-5'-phosphate decarboxylase
MNFTNKLANAWERHDSLLCVGLDPDLAKIPAHIRSLEHPLFAFNKAIIDATAEFVCAFKPNSAFYEAFGSAGITQLKLTMDYIHEKYPDVVTILDAKRADIGNTNNGYVSFAYDYLGADSITLHPYLGHEALQPFLDREDKGAIILCRTSNTGAGEFQDLQINGRRVYEHVAEVVAKTWNKNNNCLLVVGATYPEEMKAIRQLVGDMPFLVPGIGAQGGDIQAIMEAGVDARQHGMLISASRSVLYASNGADFAEAAQLEAAQLRDEINTYRKV